MPNPYGLFKAQKPENAESHDFWLTSGCERADFRLTSGCELSQLTSPIKSRVPSTKSTNQKSALINLELALTSSRITLNCRYVSTTLPFATQLAKQDRSQMHSFPDSLDIVYCP